MYIAAGKEISVSPVEDVSNYQTLTAFDSRQSHT